MLRGMPEKSSNQKSPKNLIVENIDK